MAAASNGHDLCALIEAKAALDTQNNQGMTALISSALDGKERCVQLLLDAGADREIEAERF